MGRMGEHEALASFDPHHVAVPVLRPWRYGLLAIACLCAIACFFRIQELEQLGGTTKVHLVLVCSIVGLAAALQELQFGLPYYSKYVLYQWTW
jgi:hypothetical protein